MSPIRVTRCLLLPGLVVIAAASLGIISWQTQAADKDPVPEQTLSTFMRKKLDASTQILEGLTVEDSELIQRGANSLLEMSKAERWKLIIDSDYRQHNVEFRATVKKLADAAAKGNFDNAALQWFDTTKSCIECHQDVRRARNK